MTSTAQEILACPACDYDCRGLTRCPECGLRLPSDLLTGRNSLPWAHRNTLGIAPAFFRTAYLALRHPKQLADAANAPQDDRDARRFAWICAVPSAFLFAGLTFYLTASLRPSIRRWLAREGISVTPFVEWSDLTMPLNAAINRWTLALAVLLLTLLFPWSLTTPFVFLRSNGQPTVRALRQAALTRYLAIGLPLLAVAACLQYLYFRLSSSSAFNHAAPQWLTDLLLIPPSLLAVLALFTLIVTPHLLLRRAGAKAWQLLAATLVWLFQFLAVVLLVFFAAIYLPGLARVYWQSFR